MYHYINTGNVRLLSAHRVASLLKNYSLSLRFVNLRRCLKTDESNHQKAPRVVKQGMVPTPDGPIRYCIHYVPLTNLTVKDSYLFADGYEQVYCPVVCDYKFRLDARYWQIKIAPEHRVKATFISHMGFCST